MPGSPGHARRGLHGGSARLGFESLAVHFFGVLMNCMHAYRTVAEVADEAISITVLVGPPMWLRTSSLELIPAGVDSTGNKFP